MTGWRSDFAGLRSPCREPARALCPMAVNDSSDRALNRLLITGEAFSQIEIEKPTPAAAAVSWEGSRLGRQLSSLTAFLQGSVPARPQPLLAPRGFMSLSHQPTDSRRCGPRAWGVPSYFQQGARGLGPPPTGSPSQIHSGPMGCRKSFPAPKPAGGARGHPAVQPQAPRTGQETPNEATLRQDISCNSPDHQSLLLPPSQGTGEESDSKESSQGQGIPINRNKGWGN